MKRKAPKKLSENGFATSLGVSVQALRKHIANGGTPAIGDTEGWTNYLAANGREGTGPPDIKRKIAEKRLSILTTEDLREKTKLKRLEDSLIPKDDAKRALTRFVAGLVHRLLPIAIRVSQRLALEADPQKIEAILTKELREAIAGADEFKYGLLPCPSCKAKIQL